jgi:hypothetical protein
MWMFWLWQGGLAEGRRWLTDAIAMVADDPARYPVASAKALWGMGWLAYNQGDFGDTAALGESLLDLAVRTGNPIDVRNGLTLRGMSAMAEGRYQDAIPPFERGLQICRELEPGVAAGDLRAESGCGCFACRRCDAGRDALRGGPEPLPRPGRPCI